MAKKSAIGVLKEIKSVLFCRGGGALFCDGFIGALLVGVFMPSYIKTNQTVRLCFTRILKLHRFWLFTVKTSLYKII